MCAAGTFQAASGSSKCDTCPLGSQSEKGASVCLCSAGYIGSKCDPCPAGKYSSSASSTTCSDCAKGSVSPPGSSSCSTAGNF
jgi:hypothetical protein